MTILYMARCWNAMQVTIPRRNHDALNTSAMLLDGQPVMSYNNCHTLARKVVMTGPLWLVSQPGTSLGS
jgi:hypothetical protein